MSTGPIALLKDTDLQFVPVATDFTGLTAGELGTLPNLEDAIDATLADFAQSMADQGVLSSSMDGDISDIAELAHETYIDDFTSILLDLTSAANAASAGFDTLASLIGA